MKETSRGAETTFSLLKDDGFDGIEIDPPHAAAYSVIWLHGLGADGYDFVSIVQELQLSPQLSIRFLFPHAPERPVTINGGAVMRAWFDIENFNFTEVDESGILDSCKALEELIDREINRGIPAANIALAGFSQGGSIALHTALRYRERLAGVCALSTVLPRMSALAQEASANNKDIPIFMAHGEMDPIVPYELGELSCQHLQQAGYQIQWHKYPMQHSVCVPEIADIRKWFTQTIFKGLDVKSSL